MTGRLDRGAQEAAGQAADAAAKALHMIAALGDCLGRNGDGEPGVKSLRLGLQRIASCVEGMRFGQGCGQWDALAHRVS